MTETPDHRGARHRGPPLVLVAGVYTLLFVASLVVLNGLTEGTWLLPGADPNQIVAFLDDNAGPLRVVGMLQFGAAVPLMLYAASASSQLRHLGIRAAGTTITLAGGVVAATLLGVAGLGMVTAAVTADAATPATATLVHQVVFLTGGPGTSSSSVSCLLASPSRACWPGSCRRGCAGPCWPSPRPPSWRRFRSPSSRSASSSRWAASAAWPR